MLMALKGVTIVVIIARHVPWACAMGQFTVLWYTETPLRQDIKPLYENKLAIVQLTTDQK